MPETNSSSSHSLAIYENDPTIENKLHGFIFEDSGKTIVIPDFLNSFGWGLDIIYSAGIKACYTMSCICGLFRGKKFDKEREKFEKIIKDYTGAEKVKYGWLNGVKDTRKNIISRAPCVDHQSISGMYRSITETEESMRDFIFSNQSWLIIDGEDTPSLDVLKVRCPNSINYETKIIFHVNIEGSKDMEEVIYYTKWPGGQIIRSNIEDFGFNLQYNERKGLFEKKRYIIEDNSKVYDVSVAVLEKNEIRYYCGEEMKEKYNFSRYQYDKDFLLQSDLPYKTIKFEIIGGEFDESI